MSDCNLMESIMTLLAQRKTEWVIESGSGGRWDYKRKKLPGGITAGS